MDGPPAVLTMRLEGVLWGGFVAGSETLPFRVSGRVRGRLRAGACGLAAPRRLG